MRTWLSPVSLDSITSIGVRSQLQIVDGGGVAAMVHVDVHGSGLLIFEFAWHNFFGAAGNLRAKIKRRIRRRTDIQSTHWRTRRRTDNRSTHWRIRRRTDNWSPHWRIRRRTMDMAADLRRPPTPPPLLPPSRRCCSDIIK